MAAHGTAKNPMLTRVPARQLSPISPVNIDAACVVHVVSFCVMLRWHPTPTTMHRVTNTKAFPNWQSIRRPEWLTDQEFMLRYRYLTTDLSDQEFYTAIGVSVPSSRPPRVKKSIKQMARENNRMSGRNDVYGQMVNSPKRRLIPEHTWEDICLFAVYQAIMKWDPHRPKKCPLRNFAWRQLGWAASGYWQRNKHVILNNCELAKLDTDIL